MLFFGRCVDWTALIALIVSCVLYIAASYSDERRRATLARLGRGAYLVAVLSIVASVATLGTLLVTHRFDSDYVYQHSARAMAPMYWFPSMWAGQEGSFLLWAFWTAILGTVLVFTAGRTESRVMPIYNGVLIFLATMLVIRTPYLPVDTGGGPIPTEGLGLNPNLENPWMVIHPPTLFLGLSSLTAPFSYALMALLWGDWKSWLRRALPWGLFGFALLGLAMMMGGYWAYEMLGWGGFWGWDPVENGPLIPWLCVVAFLHSAQVQRIRKGLIGTTLAFAMLPFAMGLYETFLTRTGILEKFSVHSFSTLGGVGNDVLFYVLIASLILIIVPLIARRRAVSSGLNVWENPSSREFAYLMALLLVTLCGLISTIGMSAPLLTTLGVKLHLAKHVASVPEDFYNYATYPVAVLLAIGMGVGPFLAWRSDSANWTRVARYYGMAVLGAVCFCVFSMFSHVVIFGKQLAGQLLLFAASLFALFANGSLLIERLRSGRTKTPSTADAGETPKPDGAPAAISVAVSRLATAGGAVSHVGIATLFIGIVCLVTFVRKDPDVVLRQGTAESVLGGAYTMTYLGQTGNYQTDRNNALKFAVVSKDGSERFTALLPFALRSVEGGTKQIFGHPAIAHHANGDLYLALKDGPDQFYRSPIKSMTIKVGNTVQFGPYTLHFADMERDPQAAAYVQQTGQMPPLFPVTAVIDVTYRGQKSVVRPVFVMHRDNPKMPDTPEAKLPDGWLISFQSMNAGSADAGDSSDASAETGGFSVRADTGPPVEAFELDVSTRPMINLVWLGTLLVVIGGLLSMRRRIIENRVAVDDDVVPAPPVARNGNGNGHATHTNGRKTGAKSRKAGVAAAFTRRSVRGQLGE